MENNPRKNTYRAAFDEASMELRGIVGEYEKLCVRREQVEKLVHALKPAFAADAQVKWEPVEHMGSKRGMTVVTRVAVLQAGPRN